MTELGGVKGTKEKGATRVGDQDTPHTPPCDPFYRAEGSSDVFVNNISASRQGDTNTVHKLPTNCVVPHTGKIEIGSTTVFINGRGGGRIGDILDNGCTSVMKGSTNVFIGD